MLALLFVYHTLRDAGYAPMVSPLGRRVVSDRQGMIEASRWRASDLICIDHLVRFITCNPTRWLFNWKYVISLQYIYKNGKGLHFLVEDGRNTSNHVCPAGKWIKDLHAVSFVVLLKHALVQGEVGRIPVLQ